MSLREPIVDIERNTGSPAAAPRRSFTLRQTEVADCRLVIPSKRFLVGIGTTGSNAVDQTLNFVELCHGKIPGSVAHLTIDAEANAPRPGRNTFIAGAHGAGTDPTKGLAIFQEHRPRLLEAFTTQLTRLIETDVASVTACPPRRVVEVFVVAGPGGTSGGFIHPVIDLGHEAARRVGIQSLYVHLTLIGPEMAITDIDRTVAPQQARCIYATFGRNLNLALANLAWSQRLAIATSVGRAISIESWDRLRSVSVIDRSSDESDFLRTGELVRYLGWSLYQRCFCAPGRCHDARLADEIGLEIPNHF